MCEACPCALASAPAHARYRLKSIPALRIFRFLTATDLRQVAVVNSVWTMWASKDELWRPLALRRVSALRPDAAAALDVPVRSAVRPAHVHHRPIAHPYGWVVFPAPPAPVLQWKQVYRISDLVLRSFRHSGPQGVRMFVDLKLIRDTPHEVAVFLFRTPGLSKRQIGGILADPAKYVGHEAPRRTGTGARAGRTDASRARFCRLSGTSGPDHSMGALCTA